MRLAIYSAGDSSDRGGFDAVFRRRLFDGRVRDLGPTAVRQLGPLRALQQGRSQGHRSGHCGSASGGEKDGVLLPFLNILVHTGGLGLQDLALKAALPLSDQASLGIHGHSFLTAQKGDLESSHLGEEVDLTLTYKYRPGFAVVAGLSRVIADDSMSRVTRFKNSIEEWNGDMTFAYLMTNTTF